MKTPLNEHWKEIEIKLVILKEFLSFNLFMSHKLWILALEPIFQYLRSFVVLNVAKNDKIKVFKVESKSTVVNTWPMAAVIKNR